MRPSAMPTHETLDIPDLQDHLRRAADMVAQRIAHIHEAPVVHPASFEDIAAVIPATLPTQGIGAGAALQEVADTVAPFATRIGHPRFLAWITTSPAPAGTLGDMLCTGLNQAPLSFKGGPAATVLEEIVIGWFAQLFGLPHTTGGTIVSGGTMANLMGLTVARHTHFPEVATKGLHGLPKAPVLYVSDQGHMSIERSATLLGLGADNVRSIPTDEAGQMLPHLLHQRILEDRAAGLAPFCVVAQAGSVTTGAIDPLPELASICRTENLWLHVDAAYGGAAMLTERGQARLAGIEQADSICVDPHKWFFIPLECGITLFRDGMQQRATFRARATYLGEENPHDLKNTTFILSRANRALKVWFAFRTYGTALLARIIDRNMDLAARFRQLCEASTQWDVLAPVALSIVCGRFLPAGKAGQYTHATGTAPEIWTEDAIDGLQLAILRRLEASGEGFLTPAAVRGRVGIRLCIANHRTSCDDVDFLFRELTRHGNELAAAGPRAFARKSHDVASGAPSQYATGGPGDATSTPASPNAGERA